MFKRFIAALVGVGVVLTCTAATSGFPSRPVFQSAGVGATTVRPVTDGNLALSGGNESLISFQAPNGGTDLKHAMIRHIRTSIVSHSLLFSTAADATPYSPARNWMILQGNAALAASNVTFGNNTDNTTFTFSGTGGITGANTATVSFANAALTASTFSGNGASLTNLNASNLATGTVPDARSSTTLSGSPICTAANGQCAGLTSSSTTGTVTGCTTNPAPTVRLDKVGNQVTVQVDAFSCTSNATSFTITGALTTNFNATRDQCQPVQIQDNGAFAIGNVCAVGGAAPGTLRFSTAATNANVGGGFTGSGTKGSGSFAFTFTRQ